MMRDETFNLRNFQSRQNINNIYGLRFPPRQFWNALLPQKASKSKRSKSVNHSYKGIIRNLNQPFQIQARFIHSNVSRIVEYIQYFKKIRI